MTAAQERTKQDDSQGVATSSWSRLNGGEYKTMHWKSSGNRITIKMGLLKMDRLKLVCFSSCSSEGNKWRMDTGQARWKSAASKEGFKHSSTAVPNIKLSIL